VPTSTDLPPASETPAPSATPRAGIPLDLLEGDPARGEQLARRHDCVACHITYSVAPAFKSGDGLSAIGERGTVRIADPAYTGQALTSEEYLIESILLPEVYVVEGSWLHPMDDFFDERLTLQDLADLLAWLHTFE
jgi:nitric oxide reductase subunit C